MCIRFQNLPLLLNDMRQLQWIIEAFPFEFNGIQTTVILTLYRENEIKPNQHAQARLEFVQENNISVNAYCDFYEVHFNCVAEFLDFFNIVIGEGENLRNLFIQFSESFSRCIPLQKNINQPEERIMLMAIRVDGNNPNAIYCYDVRRNGRNENGEPNHRSIGNSNKAQLLRPSLYQRFQDDSNLSFFFSDDANNERTDQEILTLVANRGH